MLIIISAKKEPMKKMRKNSRDQVRDLPGAQNVDDALTPACIQNHRTS